MEKIQKNGDQDAEKNETDGDQGKGGASVIIKLPKRKVDVLDVSVFRQALHVFGPEAKTTRRPEVDSAAQSERIARIDLNETKMCGSIGSEIVFRSNCGCVGEFAQYVQKLSGLIHTDGFLIEQSVQNRFVMCGAETKSAQFGPQETSSVGECLIQ